jgi:CBS domain containing-hemolysin-like protein
MSVYIYYDYLGLASGLTMGLLSLDITKLEIKLILGTNHEKEAINLILPLIKRHHLLLVTLLLFNAISNETLPIFLGEIVPNYIAILLSVSLVLIFGEIIPSALFTGSMQLQTTCYFITFVQFLICLFYPISYPISLLLDYWFGCHHHSNDDGSDDDGDIDIDEDTLSRQEMLALISIQSIKNVQKQKRLLKRKQKNNKMMNTSYSYNRIDQVKDVTYKLNDDNCNHISNANIINNNNTNNNSTNNINNNSSSSINNKINSQHNYISNYGSCSESNGKNNHFYTVDSYHYIAESVRGGNCQDYNVDVDPSNHDHYVDLNSLDHHHHHQQQQHNDHHGNNSLSNNEINLITGILQLSQATIESIMIPLQKVFMLSSSLHLDESTLSNILHSGYSRILIYHKHDHHYLQGYILVKELISLLTSSSSSLISSHAKLYYSNSDVEINNNNNNFNNNSILDTPPILECISSSPSLTAMNITTATTMIIDICNIRIPLFVKPDVKLLDMLTIFQTNHCHLAVITSNPSNMLSSLQHQQHQSHHHHRHHHQYHCSRPSNDTKIYGIITLEDVIERLIQHDITDESDIWRDPNVYPITMTGGRGGENDAYMKPGSVIKKIKLKMLHKNHYHDNYHHYVHIYHNDTTTIASSTSTPTTTTHANSNNANHTAFL